MKKDEIEKLLVIRDKRFQLQVTRIFQNLYKKNSLITVENVLDLIIYRELKRMFGKKYATEKMLEFLLEGK